MSSQGYYSVPRHWRFPLVDGFEPRYPDGKGARRQDVATAKRVALSELRRDTGQTYPGQRSMSPEERRAKYTPTRYLKRQLFDFSKPDPDQYPDGYLSRSPGRDAHIQQLRESIANNWLSVLLGHPDMPEQWRAIEYAIMAAKERGPRLAEAE